MPTNPPNYGLTKMIALQTYETDWYQTVSVIIHNITTSEADKSK